MELRSSVIQLGYVQLKHLRANKVIGIRDSKNMVTDVGLGAITSYLAGDVTATAEFDMVAIGTNSLATSAGMTDMQGEITTGGGARRSGANVTGTQQTTNTTDDTAQFVSTFTFTAAFPVKETGVLNHATVGQGILLGRSTFATVNVATNDSLQVTYKVVANQG